MHFLIRRHSELDIGKDDPPSSSAKARDVERERRLDARLKDAPSLPSFLAEHDRRASRVDVDVC